MIHKAHSVFRPVAGILILLMGVFAFFAACDNGGGPGGSKPKVIDITVTSRPAKIIYALGEQFDPAGIEVTALYSDAKEELVNIANLTFTGFDSDTAGSKTVTVSYQGVSAAFTVVVRKAQEILPGTITAIAVAANPADTSYRVGDLLNPAGIQVRASFTDGTTRDIPPGDLIFEYDFTTSGAKTVTVHYGDKAASFNVTVSDGVLARIEMTEKPANTMIPLGGFIDLTGMVVTASYTDGSTKVIPHSLLAVDPEGRFDNTAVTPEGKPLIIDVWYNNQGASFEVFVLGILGFEYVRGGNFSKTYYSDDFGANLEEGRGFDAGASGVEIKVKYNDGTEHTIVLRNPHFFTIKDDGTVTINYGGMPEQTIDDGVGNHLTVKRGRELESLSIAWADDDPDNFPVWGVGDPFSNVALRVWYNDARAGNFDKYFVVTATWLDYTDYKPTFRSEEIPYGTASENGWSVTETVFYTNTFGSEIRKFEEGWDTSPDYNRISSDRYVTGTDYRGLTIYFEDDSGCTDFQIPLTVYPKPKEIIWDGDSVSREDWPLGTQLWDTGNTGILPYIKAQLRYEHNENAIVDLPLNSRVSLIQDDKDTEYDPDEPGAYKLAAEYTAPGPEMEKNVQSPVFTVNLCYTLTFRLTASPAGEPDPELPEGITVSAVSADGLRGTVYARKGETARQALTRVNGSSVTGYNPAWENTVFDQWVIWDAGEGEYVEFDLGKTVEENFNTIRPAWYRNLQFDPNGGTPDGRKTVKVPAVGGGPFELALPDFDSDDDPEIGFKEPEGKQFKRWHRLASGVPETEAYKAGDSYELKNNTSVLYAIWGEPAVVTGIYLTGAGSSGGYRVNYWHNDPLNKSNFTVRETDSDGDERAVNAADWSFEGFDTELPDGETSFNNRGFTIKYVKNEALTATAYMAVHPKPESINTTWPSGYANTHFYWDSGSTLYSAASSGGTPYSTITYSTGGTASGYYGSVYGNSPDNSTLRDLSADDIDIDRIGAYRFQVQYTYNNGSSSVTVTGNNGAAYGCYAVSFDINEGIDDPYLSSPLLVRENTTINAAYMEKYGDGYVIPTPSARSNASFWQWQDGAGNVANFTVNVSDDIDFTAWYRYTVTYEAGDNCTEVTTPTPQYVTVGGGVQDVEFQPNGNPLWFTPNGIETFQYWNIYSDGHDAVRYDNSTSYPIATDLPLYAIFEDATPPTYTVTFDLNGGISGGYSNGTVTVNSGQTIANAIAMDGGNFDTYPQSDNGAGFWFWENSLGNPMYVNSNDLDITITQDTTFTAMYRYTVTFDFNEGTGYFDTEIFVKANGHTGSIEDIRAAFNRSNIFYTNPTADSNAQFLQWEDASNEVIDVNSDTITEDITLIAIYGYRVTYKAGISCNEYGDSSFDQIEYVPGNGSADPYDFTPQADVKDKFSAASVGETFQEWNTADDGTGSPVGDNHSLDNDLVIYAIFG